MPEGSARPGAVTGPAIAAGAGAGGIGWQPMGSGEPLFLRVAGQVERFIEGNGLAPGDRLPGERELGELLGVSRASVREALRSLQARGRVLVRHGKGVYVAAPDEGERALERLARLREVGMEELFAMREVLEVAAAGWTAAAATDEQLQDLVQTFETLADGVRDHRPATDLQVLDARLHLQIAEYANNRFLAMTQTLLQEMLARSMETTLAIPGRPARSVREHAGIVEALLARDPARARAAARRHIHSSRRVALRRVASERDSPAAGRPAGAP
jgi:GntR family transcriptional regulator, transcriptional repressor for pyruvate dehydrogenase complex